MTIRGLQRLLMILGRKVAAEYREIVESVFTRYTAGDTSLIEEVRANAVSDAVGVRMTHVPMSPPRILAAINASREERKLAS